MKRLIFRLLRLALIAAMLFALRDYIGPEVVDPPLIAIRDALLPFLPDEWYTHPIALIAAALFVVNFLRPPRRHDD